MNKQRSVVLIVIIVILAFIVIRKAFFSFHFGRNVEIEQYDASDLDEAKADLREANEDLNEANEEIKNEFDAADVNLKLDSIVHGGYTTISIPYPIVFHFDEPFRVGNDLVRNEVSYPRSMKGRAIPKMELDSSNSVNVLIHKSSNVTSTFSILFHSSVKYTQRISYEFTYPVKGSQGFLSAADSGSFELKGRSIFKGIFSRDDRKQRLEKEMRLRIESVIVEKIFSKLSDSAEN